MLFKMLLHPYSSRTHLQLLNTQPPVYDSFRVSTPNINHCFTLLFQKYPCSLFTPLTHLPHVPIRANAYMDTHRHTQTHSCLHLLFLFPQIRFRTIASPFLSAHFSHFLSYHKLYSSANVIFLPQDICSNQLHLSA